jgi:hypothetical protein
VNHRSADVIVAGSGPGGLPAALAAARQGAKVLMVEKNPFVGGLAVSGLPWLAYKDHDGVLIAPGLPVEIAERCRAIGGATGILQCPAHGGYVAIDPELVKLELIRLCREAGVELMLHSLFGETIVENGRVRGVVVHGKDGATACMGSIVVDATGDGDVAASAGCAYEVGNAARAIQPVTMLLRMGGVDFARFKAYLREHPDEASVHAGFESGIPADFVIKSERFIFIGLPGALKRAEQSEGYLNSVDRISFVTNPLPGTVTINCTRVRNVDGTSTADLSRAEVEGRLLAYELMRFLQKYVPGFEGAQSIGTGYQVGVRETRRIRGLRVLTEADVLASAAKPDVVAQGAYAIDIHGHADRGIVFRKVERHFDIPLGCLVPEKVDGLVVSGRAISVDPRAFGTSRVMGTCMAVGQAAGVLAARCVATGAQPREIPHADVRAGLERLGARFA